MDRINKYLGNEVALSEDANPNEVGPGLLELLNNEWIITVDKNGITKPFYFPTYTKAVVRQLFRQPPSVVYTPYLTDLGFHKLHSNTK
jgi:hypothetical protein